MLSFATLIVGKSSSVGVCREQPSGTGPFMLWKLLYSAYALTHSDQIP